MNRIVRYAVVALVAATLIATGCDEPTDEEPTDDQEAAAQEAADDEEDQPADDEPDVDEDMFVLADYETRCVDQQLDDEDEIGEIHEEIYARYGFTEESFREAADYFDGDETVESEVETRMEQCDEERARGFADEGAGELEEDVDEEEADDEIDDEDADEEQDQDREAAAEPQPDPEPMTTGSFDTAITDAGFENSELELQIRSNFDVTGQFRGERNGQDFLISISGEVSEDDALQASGERGGQSVEIGGDLHPRGVEGEISGEIAEESYRVRYEVR